jgi:pSer/pThr/pTyr-binding forkhead associated (FHA) protein/tetratricopeptide (TPR) repeat protein
MARLKVLRNQQNYKDVVLEPGRTYVVGRKEDCDIVLQPDPGISRSHLTVEQQEDGKWIFTVYSQHIPLMHNGKAHTTLVANDPTLQFFIPPYQFEFTSEAEVEAAATPPEEAAPAPEAADMAADVAVPEGMGPGVHDMISAPDDQFVPQISNMDGSIDAEFSDEESYRGNEEKTSEINLSGEPYLKFMFSTHSESIRLKGNKWIAGRDSIAQIHLDDKKASRQHFTIEKVGEQYFLKDLKSANGTLLNGQELRPNELREIKSGDIITVNQLTIIFELRDLSFSEKLKDLPLQAYSGPMILTSQEWDLQAPRPAVQALTTQQLAQLPGTVQKITTEKNKLRPVLLMGAVLIVIAGVFLSDETKRAPTNVDPQMKTFDSLSPDDKRLVRDSYALAQNLYQEGKIQNALNEIRRVHKIVPFYKDSAEMEMRLTEAQETLRNKEYIAQQIQEQEKTRRRVQSLVADCREKFNLAADVAAVKNCLAEALQLDPENGDAQSLVAEVEMRMTQAVEEEKRLAEFNENVEKGRELFIKAKNLLQNKEYQDAIGAFSAHLNSQLPDPDNLKTASKRNIASIENMISGQKNSLMNKAQSHLVQGQAREAIMYAEQAKQIDPTDYKTANFIEQTKTDLEMQMRNLYTDSVIEERFGNIELSKAKWKEIVTRDIPTGNYYLKAKRKLKQYGL